ncbi:long-chain fatty acid--CoA ligase [Methylocaldum sp.]|uniref:long-chain-fatty-acid--CoA ligase n=1 Tax=Methylocaldum sp. TaxID=1969727 RepID=UPI002D61ABA9|nr:long-chain fatty acid--CoA ligase [Methylocaldum sp.]HYE36565.1 long-chain fatty acid--CoA ligase [Methylocaldum sp.]
MSSLIHALRESARLYPDRPAVILGSQIIDHATMGDRSDRMAAALAARGVAKGDRVALYCPNSAEFAIAYTGIVKAGATVVPINLLLNTEEIGFILNDSGAKGLIFHQAFSKQTESVLQAAPGIEFRVSVGGEAEGAVAFEAFLDSDAPIPEIDCDPQEDLVVILYTSGTTGRPKGAMLTHGNLVANTRSVREAMHWRPGKDVVLLVLPMFHAFAATVGMLTPLTNGCAFVPLPRFEPDQVADAIHASRATIFLGVPSMYTVLLRLRDERVPLLSSVRYCVSGGAALPVDVLRRFEEKFNIRIYEGDGPTECSPVTCVNPIDGFIKPGTVGLPVPGVEMKILDEDGRELPCGEVGEIAVRGASVMNGYWKQPEATSEVFRGEWFLTGDLGTRDEDGYFSIVDRKKDLIIVNGMNVYPRMIEEVLYRFPPIREAAVVGEPHDLHGEIPVAYIASDESRPTTEAEVRAFCREHLGRHQVPRKIVFLPELPKNGAGKILKRQLRKHGEIERGVQDLE